MPATGDWRMRVVIMIENRAGGQACPTEFGSGHDPCSRARYSPRYHWTGACHGLPLSLSCLVRNQWRSWAEGGKKRRVSK